MKKEMVGGVPGNTPSYQKLINDWQKFYQKVFNLTVDLSQVRIPEKRDDFNWLIIVLQGLTAQKLFEKCRGFFLTWKWTDASLDKVLDQTKSARSSAISTYAVWVRDRIEADAELKEKSADYLKEHNISGITLEERLLLELFRWWKTKKHLDIEDWTLCSGSRYFDGIVPGVRWHSHSRKLIVHGCHSGDARSLFLAREVVSC